MPSPNSKTVPPAYAGGTEISNGAFRFVVPESYGGATVWSFLKGYCGLSSALIRSVKFISGGITVGGQPVHTDRVLSAGEQVAVLEPHNLTQLEPFDFELKVLYESDNVVVFDKPCGIVVHPTLGYPKETLGNAFAAWCRSKGVSLEFRPVYRIDKDTSGCIAVAKSRYTAGVLNNGINKEYICVAEGSFEQKSGVIDRPIGLEDGSFIKRCVRSDGKPSVTEYSVEREFNGLSLVRVRLRTGRTHQIRVHMAAAGHPLAGDTFYGGSGRLISRQALHCVSISFQDMGRLQRVESPLPQDILKLING